MGSPWSTLLGNQPKQSLIAYTDNGAENFTWPDGGQTPFAGGKGTALEGGFRVPAMVRWPGHVPAGKIENGIFSGMDWFPTFVAAAGDPNIVEELKAGKNLAGQNYLSRGLSFASNQVKLIVAVEVDLVVLPG